MPWKAFKTGDEFCVFKLDGDGERTGKTLGCHPTNDKAKAQVKALYADEEKGEAKEVDLYQVARSAIELARAWCNAGPDGLEVLNKKNTNRLLNSLERDLKEAKDNGSGIKFKDAMTVKVDNEHVTFANLVAVYREAKTKTVDGKSRPASDFLVVEDSDKPTTWHLPVKKNGKPDHRLMGAAKAALTSPGGHRGNKYQGPDKAKAITRLKALYKSEELEWSESMKGLRELLEQALNLLAEPEGGVGQAQESNLCESAMLAECFTCGETGDDHIVTGMAVNFTESQEEGEPAYIDLIPVSPGWGNKKDNHYYDLPVLKEYAHVWEGAKMWATNHHTDDKNALNQISEVITSPVGYTESGVPIARAAILNPEFEEVARRRQAAGILNSLHCSILGTGRVRKKEYVKDGRRGKYIEAIDKEDAGIDWVTKAGAGGHAYDLAESSNGGETMEIEREVAEETTATSTRGGTVEVEETEEVALAEQQEEAAQEPQPLPKEEIVALLSESNLPKASQERLAGAEYEDGDAVKAAIVVEVAYVKRLTGSGKPTGLGASTASRKERMSEADAQKRFGEIEKGHGLIVQEEA